MARGKVKWFNDQNGFGFIAPDDGSEDVFFELSSIIGRYATIAPDEAVAYDKISSDKGPRAASVQKLSLVAFPQDRAEKASAASASPGGSSSSTISDPWFNEAINAMVSIYVSDRNHGSQGRKSIEELERIGRMLNEKGGKQLMRDAHAEFTRRCRSRNVRDSSGYISAPRSLEYRWNGIGTWMS
jgi:CspA family cold shock protein